MAIKNDLRSWKLEAHEMEAFNDYLKKCVTLEYAAKQLDITAERLSIIQAKCSCHPDTYKKLNRKVFKQVA